MLVTPVSDHLTKTPKFSQSKAFSWNLLKRSPLVRDHTTCGVDLYGRSIHTTTPLRVCEKI